MQITQEIILLNSYYVGVAIALIIRDILWLRIVLIMAGMSLISYGFLTTNYIVVSWNFLFFSINLIQVVRLILERKPTHLNDDIVHIYNEVFSDMRKKDFLYLWNNGYVCETENQKLCEKGKKQKDLLLIISGEARVKKKDKTIILPWGHFIAEMAFITGKEASADVFANGKLKYIGWNYKQIEKIKKRRPDIMNKLQVIISKDLTKKLSS